MTYLQSNTQNPNFDIYDPSLVKAAEMCGVRLPPVHSVDCEDDVTGYTIKFIDIIDDSIVMLLKHAGAYYSFCINSEVQQQAWSDETYTEHLIEPAKHVISIYDVDCWLSLSDDDYMKLCRAHEKVLDEESKDVDEQRKQRVFDSMKRIEKEMSELKQKYEELYQSYEIMTKK